MGNVIRYRKTQEQSPEEFILQIIDDRPCKYCMYYEACKAYLSAEELLDVEELSDGDIISECPNFDNTLENFEQIYKENYC